MMFAYNDSVLPNAGLPIPLPDLTGVPEFTAGLLYGLTGNNHLDEIKVCMEDVDPLL